MNKEKITKISKHMSYVLRHHPDSIGITLDNNGWVDINELIEKSKSKIDFSFEELLEVVATSDKKRFTIYGEKIRAAQGHSVDVDLQHPVVVPPFNLYHGTAERFLESIMKNGLNKMNRLHVHMYSEEKLDKAKETGARHQKSTESVILIIEAKQMHNEGFKFYKSENDVYLIDSVPPKYIKIYKK